MNTLHAESLAGGHETGARVAAGGSISEAIGGAGAIILCILALCGVLGRYLAPIAILAVAGSLFIEGAAIGTRYLKRLREVAGSGRVDELGLGITVEFLAGAAGLVLGILALIGMSMVTLMSIAVLIFGAALLMSSGSVSRPNLDHLPALGPDLALQRVFSELSTAASGAQILLGFAAVILGILALVGLSPFVLAVVGLLCAACSILFTGTTIGSKMVNLLHV